MVRKSFIMYLSFFEAIEELPKDLQLEVYRSLMLYGLTGEMPEGISPVSKAMLTSFKPNIDAAHKSYDSKVANGRKGGRKSSKSVVDEKPKETELNRIEPNLTETNRNEPKETETNRNEPKETEIDLGSIRFCKDKDKDDDKDDDMDKEHTTDTKVSVCAHTRDGDEQVVTLDAPKKSKRTKKPKKDIIDPNREQPFFNDSDLDDAFREYLRDRAEQGTDNTARAVKLLYTEMKKHDRSLWIPALEKATISHWKSIYFDSLERMPVRGSPSAKKPDVFEQAMNELIEEYGPEFCGTQNSEFSAFEEVVP